MKVTKKMAFLSAIGLSLLASACSGGAGQADPGKAGEAAPTGTPADTIADSIKKVVDTPTTLTFAQPGLTVEAFNQRYGDQIRKKFPNYTINYLATTGANFGDTIATRPDLDILMASASGMPVYLTGYQLESDISDLIKKYNYDVTKLQPAPMDVQRLLGGGAIYGFPNYIGVLVFLYNKDLFDKFGVDYPKDGMTWDETYELARKMTRTEGGQKYQGLGMAWEHIMGWNQLSALYFDPKTQKSQFASDGVRKVFDNLSRIWTIPGNEPPDNKYSLGAIRNWFLKDQTTAMYIDADGLIAMTAAALKNWDLARFPVFPDQPDVGPSPNPTYSFITNTSKQRDAAFQVLDFLTSEPYQQWAAANLGAVPSLKNTDAIMNRFGENVAGFSGKNAKALTFPKSAQMQQTSPYYNSIGVQEISTAINSFLAGKDANTVLREAAERADKRVAEEQAKAK